MHAFGHLLQDEWQVFTTPETHLPKIPLERITIFLLFSTIALKKLFGLVLTIE